MTSLVEIYEKLPSSPPGKNGWPWRIDSLPSSLRCQRFLDEAPLITIVTPNLNYGSSLEATIRSVLLQGYHNLRYFVVDGGSTDESLEIIAKYRPWLAGVSIGPDGGQANAINKILLRENSGYLNWLNSDDILRPNALFLVAKAVVDTRAPLITGGRFLKNIHDQESSVQILWKEGCWREFIIGIPNFPQDATFFRADMFALLRGVRPDMVYFFDTEFYYRFLSISSSVACVDALLSEMRVIPGIKTLRTDPRKTQESLILASHYNASILRRCYTILRRFRVSNLFLKILQLCPGGKKILLYSFDHFSQEWLCTQMTV